MRFRFSIFACLLLLTACRAEREPDVWFIHATDPHLFEEPEHRDPQEKLNEQAFEAFLQSVRSVPEAGVEPDFLVITGDFGIAEAQTQEEAKDRCTAKATAEGAPAAGQPAAASPPAQNAPAEQTPAQDAPAEQAAPQQAVSGAASPSTAPAAQGESAPNSRAGRIARLAALLQASPVRDVFFVPGNNDVVCERADEASLKQAADFFEEVERKAGGKVALHDLTRCYQSSRDSLSGCFADIAGTSFRLVGFPSYSFKSSPPDQLPAQEAQMNRFAALVEQAKAQNRKVLVVTHIAEMDDPYQVEAVLQQRLQGVPAERQKRLSAWGVDPKLVKRWKELVESSTVVGVLTGHFHDSYPGTYQPPYRWASRSPDRADPAKVLLAPPLAARLQGDSHMQARGYSLIGLADDDLVGPRLFWYDQARNTFQPPQGAAPARDDEWRISGATRWIWSLGQDKADLARAVVIAIAFLLAFLTVVALWEIPPPDQRLANPAPGGQTPPGTATTTTATATTATTTTTTTNAAGRPNVLPSNIGKTVLTGLTGFLAVDFLLKTFWEGSGIDVNAYFILHFILFFLAILILFSLLQGLAEGLRSRVILQHPVAPRTPMPRAKDDPSIQGRSFLDFLGGLGYHVRRAWHFLTYWVRRIWTWVLSLRSFLLVFFDTSFSLLRGSNQTQSAAFEKTVTDLHWSLVATADRVRDSIKGALLRVLGRQAEPENVRVGISVLSDDETYLYYISSERGSLYQTFPKRSLAWVAVYAGVARWWHKDFAGPAYETKPIVLFENQREVLHGLEEDLRLADYYQARGAQDYQAFVVLPVPWARRDSDYFRKAAIHISFREPGDLEKIWPGLLGLHEETRTGSRTVYTYPDNWTQMLRSKVRKTEDAKHDSVEQAAAEGQQATSGQAQQSPRQIHLEDQQLSAVLLESVDVLTELLRFFNQRVFEERIKPQRRP